MLQNAKPVVLLHTKNELSKRNQENNPIYNSSKMFKDEFNQKGERSVHQKLYNIDENH
jgi:hypothetical protein